MLCFPQVLFSGAMLPVGTMTGAGHAISVAMINRWAFEATGRLLDVDPGGRATTAWSAAMTGGVRGHVTILAVMTALSAAATVAVLSRSAGRWPVGRPARPGR